MNGQIFISYRRDDSLGSTGRIYDRLLVYFPREQIFMDVDTIPPGEDFIQAIEKAVGSCDILLAVIGRDWLQIKDRHGRRSLENPKDFVRTEIKAALDRNICVMPVLVEEAEMPNEEDLPDDLKPLVRRNAIELSHTRFHADVDRLIKAVQKVLREEEQKVVLKAEQEKLREAQQQAQKKEVNLWNVTIQKGSIEAYSQYLNAYSTGKFAEDAKSRISALQEQEEGRKKQEHFERLSEQGRLAYERGNYREALRLFSEAETFSSTDPSYEDWIRKCEAKLVEQQRLEEEREAARRQRAEEEARQQKQRQEQERLEQERLSAEKRKEQEATNLERQGDKLRKAKDYAAALDHYERALRLQPTRERSLKGVEQCRVALQEEKNLQKGNNSSIIPKPIFQKKWAMAAAIVLGLAIAAFLLMRNKNDNADKRIVTPVADSTNTNRPYTNKPEIKNPTDEIAQSLLQGMEPIPGGKFTMGSNTIFFAKPAHAVVVKPFRLSKFEVTRSQWNAIMHAALPEPLNKPVTNVSWNDVQNFIAALNKAAGQTFRLPTEAEWEFACATGHEEGYEQSLNDYSWNLTNAGDSVHPVGQKLPNAYGLYDMLGNAYEWCADSKADYQGKEKDSTRKMLRGGDFRSKLGFVSPRVRNWDLKDNSTERIGFRLAMDSIANKNY